MRRALPRAVAAIGLVLVVVGAVVLARAGPPGTVTHGGSHEPLLPADSVYESSLELTFDDAEVLWTAGDLLGAGLAVMGAWCSRRWPAGHWGAGQDAARGPGPGRRPACRPPRVLAPVCGPNTFRILSDLRVSRSVTRPVDGA